MRRREFITGIGVSVTAWMITAEAQQARVRRVSLALVAVIFGIASALQVPSHAASLFEGSWGHDQGIRTDKRVQLTQHVQLEAVPGLLTVEVVSLPVRPHATLTYLALKPPKPTAAVILLAGGNGVLGLEPSGAISTNLSLNFLVRERGRFALQGLFVAVPDVASDRLASGLNGQVRLSAEHRSDLREVVKSVKVRSGGVPVWIVGTSSGALSAVNAARKTDHASQAVAGLVLVSPQTANHVYLNPDGTQDTVHSCGKNVHDDPTLGSIRGPVLVVVNSNDACQCSPPATGGALLDAVGGFPENVMSFASSAIRSPHVCDARTPHGFLGIEASVVSAIVGWVERGGTLIPHPKSD